MCEVREGEGEIEAMKDQLPKPPTGSVYTDFGHLLTEMPHAHIRVAKIHDGDYRGLVAAPKGTEDWFFISKKSHMHDGIQKRLASNEWTGKSPEEITHEFKRSGLIPYPLLRDPKKWEEFTNSEWRTSV